MNIEVKSYPLSELLDLRKNNMLVVNAEYQRGEVWRPYQKKRLIDSVLRGYPISLIYLHYIKREVAGHQREDFEIIDGQQRINALYEFHEGAFKLFDPVKDESHAQFPNFIKALPCPWAGKDFDSVEADIKTRFLETELPVALITTENQNEARDLFIRLQAGIPLNAQEKRDAWPGNFTDFILKVGGKPEIARYPGHDFFRRLMGARTSSGRGKFRQIAAQLAMLFLNRQRADDKRFCDINASAIDDFYYANLDFDSGSAETGRFLAVLNKITGRLGDGMRKKIILHEAIHLVLLVDLLLDDYTNSWERGLAAAFDDFRDCLVRDKLTKFDPNPGEYWLRYGSWTRVNTDRAETIQRRHFFFCQKMLESMRPQIKLRDPNRLFGAIEREIIYYRDKKKCHFCDGEIPWSDFEVHHLVPHIDGGPTIIDNGVAVHRDCHPRGFN